MKGEEDSGTRGCAHDGAGEVESPITALGPEQDAGVEGGTELLLPLVRRTQHRCTSV